MADGCLNISCLLHKHINIPTQMCVCVCTLIQYLWRFSIPAKRNGPCGISEFVNPYFLRFRFWFNFFFQFSLFLFLLLSLRVVVSAMASRWAFQLSVNTRVYLFLLFRCVRSCCQTLGIKPKTNNDEYLYTTNIPAWRAMDTKTTCVCVC